MTTNNAFTHLLTTHTLSQITTPCPTCGYDIIHTIHGYTVATNGTTTHTVPPLNACVNCYPPRGCHQYSSELFALHPHKKQGTQHR